MYILVSTYCVVVDYLIVGTLTKAFIGGLWHARGGLIADSVAGPMYTYMSVHYSGAQSCFALSGGTFFVMVRALSHYRSKPTSYKFCIA